MKKVFKYATGAEIPEGAIYLSTVTQTHEPLEHTYRTIYEPCWYVWHYFLVEVDE